MRTRKDLLQRRLLIILAACLALPVALAGGVSKAAPFTQTPTPDPAPTKPILLTDPVPDPHQDGVLSFPQTGHTLRGKFLQYWQQYGGLAQFGYPLTEEFFEPSGPDNTPLQVQYFERNRFELHTKNALTPNEVLLGLLGREFHAQDPPVPQPPASPSVLYFPETGHTLSGKFRDYWEAHGGLFMHGFPITEPTMEQSTNGNHYLVQRFERSRFELHPENAASPYEVLLGQLGRQLSEKRGYPFGWYPAFGYAIDFSWLAGYVDLYASGPFFCPSCGCSRLRYGLPDIRIQLNRPRGNQYPFSVNRLGTDHLVVVFGRLAREGELTQACPIYIAPVYYVTAVQDNPSK
jgi:hypothetical protein